MAVIVPAIVGLAAAGYQIYQGEQQKKQAKKAAANNVRPVYNPTIPQSEFDSLKLLQSRAGQGMSDSAKNMFQQQADRGLSSVLDTIIKTGGNPNDASRAYQGYADSIGRMALLEDRAKLENLNNYLGQQRRISAMQTDNYDKDFSVNKYAPFMDEQARIAQMRTIGQQQTNAGVNTAASTIANYAGNISQKNDIYAVNGGHSDWRGRPVYPNQSVASASSNTPMSAYQPLSTYSLLGMSPSGVAASPNNIGGTQMQVQSNNLPTWNTYDMNSYDTSGFSPAVRDELALLMNQQNPFAY